MLLALEGKHKCGQMHTLFYVERKKEKCRTLVKITGIEVIFVIKKRILKWFGHIEGKNDWIMRCVKIEFDHRWN